MKRGQEPTSGASSKRSLSMLLESPEDAAGDGELADDSSLDHAEKKRRLSAEQVRSLEMSFEIENKLEPERKLQLANELGLRPRQVAIWFQNRRARWKTKQLERDYDILKAAYDSLLCERDKLQAEIVSLSVKLHAGYNEIGRGAKDDLDVNDQSNSDVLLKPAKGLCLQEKSILEKPAVSAWKQRLPSPLSSSDALSSDSNRVSPLNDSPEQRVLQGRTGCGSCSIEVGLDHKAAFSLQAIKFDVGDPAHHLLVARDEPFGTVCNPNGCQHIIYELEDSIGEESYCAPFVSTLEQGGCWPWYWES